MGAFGPADGDVNFESRITIWSPPTHDGGSGDQRPHWRAVVLKNYLPFESERTPEMRNPLLAAVH